MKTIRFGTFETNSSSAHSLILVSKSDFEKFQKNTSQTNKEKR